MKRVIQPNLPRRPLENRLALLLLVSLLAVLAVSVFSGFRALGLC